MLYRVSTVEHAFGGRFPLPQLLLNFRLKKAFHSKE